MFLAIDDVMFLPFLTNDIEINCKYLDSIFF